mgnify:CR=1 FL=1
MILLYFIVVILVVVLLIAMLKDDVLATALIAIWLGFFATLLAQSFDKL